MALIECPNCGGKISDTAEKCVHCGKSAKKEVEQKPAEPMQKFATLSGEKQKQLQSEFNGAFPEYGKSAKTHKVYMIAYYADIIIAVPMVISMALYLVYETTALVIAVVVFAALFAVLGVGLKIVDKSVERSMVKYWKVFGVWLTECKQIAFDAVFDGRKREIYDSTTVSDFTMRKIQEYKESGNK